jgi:hypothetical protein
MRQHPFLALLLAIVGMVFAVVGPGGGQAGAQPSPGAEVEGARYRLDPAAAERDGAQLLGEQARAAGFRFEAGATPTQEEAFTAAIAQARPQARRLIDLVDGITDVRFADTQGSAVGVTVVGDHRYEVAIDMRRAESVYGRRGIARVVLHELGHVVDSALVTDAVMAPLQAAIPSAGCGRHCDPPTERFAETFSKWATGDAGAEVSLVRDPVPLPAPSLEAWGAPLAQLAEPGAPYSSPGL